MAGGAQFYGGRLLPEELFHRAFENVVAHLDDAEFALGAFRRVAGVRGVDHDGLTEFAADRAGRGLGRIGGAEDVADFGDGIDAFVDQRDAGLGAGLVAEFRRTFAGVRPDMNFTMLSN